MNTFGSRSYRLGRSAVIGLLVSIACMGAKRSFAGTLWTIDGKCLEGSTTITASGQVKIVDSGGRADSFNLSDVLYVSLNPAPAPLKSEYLGSLSLHDIGEAAKPGEAIFSRGIYALAGDGAGIGGARDSFHFVSQGIYGDGEISARIDDVHSDNAIAGIMLRESDSADARNVSLIVTHGNELHLLIRAEAGKGCTDVKLGQVTLPVYLKLSRGEGRPVPVEGARAGAPLAQSEGLIRGFTSTDGAEWTLVAGASLGDSRSAHPVDIALPAGAMGGLVLAAGESKASGSAAFDQVVVREYHSPTAVPDAPHSGRYQARPQQDWMRGVLLSEGTFLAGGTVVTDGTTGWKIAYGDQKTAVDLGQVARIQFEPVSPVVLARLPQDSRVTDRTPLNAGVLLTSGDYLSGAITAFEPDRIEINNVILGLSSLPPKKVTAIAFRGEHGAPDGFRIQLVNGSVLITDGIGLPANGDLQFVEKILGHVTVPLKEIISIRRNAQIDSAMDFAWNMEGSHNTNVDAMTCFDRASPLWLNLNDEILERGVVMLGDVSMSCHPPAGARYFQAIVGIPAPLGSQAKVRFTVLVDGKEAYRTAVMSTKDKPVTVRVPVTAGGLLTLRVENTNNSVAPVYGLWGNPLFFP